MVSANLFLFLAFTIFQANAEELSTSFFQIFKIFLKPGGFFICFVALMAFFLADRPYRFMVALLSMLAILIWLQGNLLVWNYGLLDGRKIDWDEKSMLGWFEVSIWSLGLILVFLTTGKSARMLLGFATMLGLLQLALFCYQWMTYQPAVNKQIAGTDLRQVADNIFSYSPNSNIVHIIADGFQADVIAELLQEGETGKKFQENLQGFTYFSDNIAAFPYTHMSVPAILTGHYYRNQIPISDFQKKFLGSESILGLAKTAGYEIDMIIEPGALTNIYSKAPHDNLFPLNSQKHISQGEQGFYDAARVFDFSLFRAVPHFLKRQIYNNQRWFAQSVFFKNEFAGLRNFAHMGLLQEATQKMKADRTTPVYKLFHLMLSHTPMVTTPDCQYAGEVLPLVRPNILSQSRCGLIELVRFFHRMKELGIYENSTIVLMGDHGVWVRPLDAVDIIDQENGVRRFIDPRLLGLSNSALAIKPQGVNHSFRFSNVQTSITDTARTIAEVSGFPNSLPGDSVLGLDESVERERKFMFYRYKRSEWRDNHLSPIHEFVIRGNSVDSGSWSYEKTYLENGAVEVRTDESVLWQATSLQPPTKSKLN